ncbi:MAG: AAA family ATPase [Thermoplasmata archaeon]|nr:MAG: AAA family ATPase [Thermoplasmata archaeon]
MAKKKKGGDGDGPGGPELMPTGVDDLDEILRGGIPVGYSVLLTGASGSGKTSTCMEILCRGASSGEPGVMFLTSETPEQVVTNFGPFHFFDKGSVDGGQLVLVDMNETYKDLGIAHPDTGLSIDDGRKLLEAIEKAVDDAGAKRLVIDSISGVLATFEQESRIRTFLKELVRSMASKGITTIMTSEIPPDTIRYSTLGFEDALVDGVILLDNMESRGDLLRSVQIIKMRGADHSRSVYVMDLTVYGIIIAPVLKSYSKGGGE